MRVFCLLLIFSSVLSFFVIKSLLYKLYGSFFLVINSSFNEVTFSWTSYLQEVLEWRRESMVMF